MRIGINYKRIFAIISQMGFLLSNEVNIIQSDINNLETRIATVEENLGTEWIEITTNGIEAEITQPCSEIRMSAKVVLHSNYVVTSNYDSAIFHNLIGNAPMYFICGNPTENNYGCKFKYMVTNNGKQYVTVDSCFDGGSAEAFGFRAWIKPV